MLAKQPCKWVWINSLQMGLNKFRISPWYSWNNMANTSLTIFSLVRRSANRMVGQGGTRSVIGGYTCWTWGNTRSLRYQCLPCPHSNNTWQLFSSKACSHSSYSSHPTQGFKHISKITKERRMRKRPSHNQTPKTPHTKREGLTLSIVKLSITIHQISKERLEGVDKRYWATNREI